MLDYVAHSGAKTAVERAAPETEKTGVFTGRYVTNPVNGEQLPVWVSDYVLAGHGTGAIMAVPGHDERDFQFAQAFRLEIVQVVEPADGSPVELPSSTRAGRALRPLRAVFRPGHAGCDSRHRRMARLRGSREGGRRLPAPHLAFSRQRYWGAAIPIVHCRTCGLVRAGRPVPVLLPEVQDFKPKGGLRSQPPRTGCARPVRAAERSAPRDRTMDTFVDSSWYYLRYADPANELLPFGREIVDYWLPVRQYIGGIEHAILHLLYARFFTKVMNDLGLQVPRAVPAALHAGDDHEARREDVEVEGQRRRPGRDGRALRGRRRPVVHPVHGPGGSRQGMARRGHRGHRTVARPALAPRPRGGCSGARSRLLPAVSSFVRPTGRSRGSRTTSSAGFSFTRRSPRCSSSSTRSTASRNSPDRRRRSGSRRDRGEPRPALRAAHRRGALASPRAISPLGGALAGGRPRAARGRDVRARRPGERESSRPCGRSGRPVGGRSRRAGEELPRVQAQVDGKRIRRVVVVPGKLVTRRRAERWRSCRALGGSSSPIHHNRAPIVDPAAGESRYAIASATSSGVTRRSSFDLLVPAPLSCGIGSSREVGLEERCR